MARKPSSRVVLNRAALTAIGQAVADGVMEVGRTIHEVADPPDATPFGAGLVTRGGVLVYVNGKKVDGWGQDGRQPKPPRAAQVSRSSGVVGIIGWGFPAKFQNNGTIHHPPNPFASQAIAQVTPHIPEIIGSVVRPRLRSRS